MNFERTDCFVCADDRSEVSKRDVNNSSVALIFNANFIFG